MAFIDDASKVLRRANFIVPGATRSNDSYAFMQAGVIPAARMTGGTPVNGNVFAIGAGTYQFVTSLTTIQTYTQIKVLGSAALSWGAALDAINGVTNANVVAGSTSTVEAVVADMVTATVLRIRKADVRGGNPIAGTVATTALTATVGGGGVWTAANLNVSGKAPGDCQASICQVAITAGMVTAASFQVELPFLPTVVHCFVTASTGIQRASTDAITIAAAGQAVSIALGGGASPAIQAGDLVTVFAVA